MFPFSYRHNSLIDTNCKVNLSTLSVSKAEDSSVSPSTMNIISMADHNSIFIHLYADLQHLSCKYRSLKNWVNFWAILNFVEIFKTFLKTFRKKLRYIKKTNLSRISGKIFTRRYTQYFYLGLLDGSIQTYLCAIKLCFSASNATLLFHNTIPPFTLTARSVRWGKESYVLDSTFTWHLTSQLWTRDLKINPTQNFFTAEKCNKVAGSILH